MTKRKRCEFYNNIEYKNAVKIESPMWSVKNLFLNICLVKIFNKAQEIFIVTFYVTE